MFTKSFFAKGPDYGLVVVSHNELGRTQFFITIIEDF